MITIEEIELKAKEETSFPKMCYPDDIIEGQCRKKFIEGAKWILESLKPEIEKAEKWDKLAQKIDSCYGEFDENGEEGESDYENEFGSEPDLCTIGEYAASAFGYL
jgi:hypothetical protein